MTAFEEFGVLPEIGKVGIDGCAADNVFSSYCIWARNFAFGKISPTQQKNIKFSSL
jgi:hypothetical protein